jgi:hypothetical protein
MALESGDLLRKRGLCRSQDAGSARYAASIDHLDKALQLPEIDAHDRRMLFINRKAARVLASIRLPRQAWPDPHYPPSTLLISMRFLKGATPDHAAVQSRLNEAPCRPLRCGRRLPRSLPWTWQRTSGNTVKARRPHRAQLPPRPHRAGKGRSRDRFR